MSELLSYVAANANDITDLSREADTRTTGWGNDPRSAPTIPIRSTIASVSSGPIRVEEIVQMGDTVRYEAGLRRGVKRTGGVRTVDMPIYDRFTPALSVPMPYAYAFARDVGDSLVKRLVMHGILVEELSQPADVSVAARVVQYYRIEPMTVPRGRRDHGPARLAREATLVGRRNLDSSIRLRSGFPQFLFLGRSQVDGPL